MTKFKVQTKPRYPNDKTERTFGLWNLNFVYFRLRDLCLYCNCLMLGAQAAGAQIHLGRYAVNEHGGPMDVRHRALVGAPLGMAHIVPELGRFAADITLQILFPLTM